MNTDLQDIKYKELKESSENSNLCVSAKIRVLIWSFVFRFYKWI